MNDLLIKSLKKIVNTKSYSSSKDFIGYFESYSFGECKKEAIDLFIEVFSNMSNECFLICSITQSVIREKFFSENEKNMISTLSDIGWIEKDKDGESIERNFLVFSLTQNDTNFIRLLCELVLDNNLFGHVFFFWTKVNLIIYPHDDYGFGVFAPNRSKGRIIGLNFLTQAENSGLFRVDIRALESGEP